MPANADCFSEEQLTLYAEGTLPTQEMDGVAAHLRTCVWCQATLNWVQEHLFGELDSDGEIRPRVDSAVHDAATRSYKIPPTGLDTMDESEATGPLPELNGYVLVRMLGQGGYGTVYEAYHKVLNRNVAIKVLRRDFANQATSRRRFIREARAGAAINHPNVVTIHNVDEAGQMPFLIMELINGESLRERIRREPKLDILDVLRISAQVAQGLAAAHAQGIIHRDVKPGNIMLVDSVSRVKITDFGLARVKFENVELTSRGLTLGTPAYMSPEQVRGEELDARSDLFALGCVIYAMFAGHSPFHGRTTLDIARRIDGYQPPPLTETHKIVPEFLSAIVERLLKKDREQRYQSAAEVADVLNRHLALLNQTPSDQLPAALRMQLSEPARPSKRPLKLMVWTSVTILCLVAIGFAWKFSGPAVTTSLPPGRSESGSQSTVAVQNGAASSTIPSVPRKKALTVAKTASADFTTVSDALQNVAAGGQVMILDDSEYVESIRLDNAQQLAGVVLSAPRHATLRSNETGAVLAIRGIPNLRLEGLRVVAPQAQFGIEIIGNCPGLVLQDIEINKTPNSEETRGNIAALFLHDGASGSSDQPIAIRRLSLHAAIVGVVIGNQDRNGTPPRHILMEECSIHGLSRDESTLLVLLRGPQDIIVRRNIFARGVQGLSVLSEENAIPQRCHFEHNTWHDVDRWITVTGKGPQPLSLGFHHNLIVDGRRLSPSVRELAPTAEATFVNNIVFNPHQPDAEDFSPFAKLASDLQILSYEPSHADYLKPDFEHTSSPSPAAPFPGRYSPDNAR